MLQKMQQVFFVAFILFYATASEYIHFTDKTLINCLVMDTTRFCSCNFFHFILLSFFSQSELSEILTSTNWQCLRGNYEQTTEVLYDFREYNMSLYGENLKCIIKYYFHNFGDILSNI